MSKPISVLHDISVDTTKTKAFRIPENLKGMSVIVPAKTNGAVSMEFYIQPDAATEPRAGDAVLEGSYDTDWTTADQAADGTAFADIADSGVEGDLILLTSAQVDFLKGAAGLWARFVDASAQSADVTYRVHFS